MEQQERRGESWSSAFGHAEAAQSPECQQNDPKHWPFEELQKSSNHAHEAEDSCNSFEANDGESEASLQNVTGLIRPSHHQKRRRRQLTVVGARIKSTLSVWSNVGADYPLLSTPSKYNNLKSFRRSLSESRSGRVVGDRNPMSSMMPEYGKLARLLSVCVVATICLSIYQEVVQHKGVSGCSPSTLGELSTSSHHCSDVRLYHVYMPLFTRQAIAIVVGFAIMTLRVFQTWRLRTLVTNGPDAPVGTAKNKRQLEFVAGHWTTAASPDTLADVSGVLAKSHLLAFLIVMPTTALSTLAMIQTTYQNKQMSMTGDDAAAACCPAGASWDGGGCSEICRAGFNAVIWLTIFNIGLLLCLAMPVMLVPAKVWSPMTERAAKVKGDTFMRRMLKLPAIVLVLCSAAGPLLFLGFAKRFGYRRNEHAIKFPSQVYSGALVLDVFLAMTTLLLLLWITPWGTALRNLTHWAGAVCSRLGLAASDGSAAARGGILKCMHAWRYRQLVLLLALMFLFGVDTLDSREAGNSKVWLRMWPVLLMRAVTIFLLLFSRDEEIDFEDLEREGAGFGLVVNARDLRREFSRVVEGRGEEPRGRVRRYKATLLRMCETMAVSYRWQEQAINIGDLGPINMKLWQMDALVKAIDKSNCLYVWIDACGVPQQDCQMKRALLSRMMSIYASSFVTTVLLSRELGTDRYHERVWTMQEYCSSPKLLIFKEDGTEVMEDGHVAQATHGFEADVVEQLRFEHLARQPTCTPVWLDGLSSVLGQMEGAVARLIYNTYLDLCKRLHCTHRADTIRALYPLLWNTPAESQDELVLIMNSVSTQHGIEQDREIHMLTSAESLWDQRSTSMANSQNSMRYEGVDEDMDNRREATVFFESFDSMPDDNDGSQRHEDGSPLPAGKRNNDASAIPIMPLPGLLNEDGTPSDDPAENV